MNILTFILNSNFFVGLATILTATVAIIIYFSQKKNDKIQAARVLLTEIRNAEEQIAIINEKINGEHTVELPESIIQQNNWKKYSYLFISEFDQDELKLINSFYTYGELIESFVRRNNNFFWITTEQRAKVTVETVAKFINDSIKESQPKETNIDITDKIEKFSTGMDKNNRIYCPKITMDRVDILLKKIEKITTSSVGVKLKKISKLYK